jgi:hypothetical protein
VTFICDKCRSGAHDQCPGGTWCDCLHRTTRQATSAPSTSDYTLQISSSHFSPTTRFLPPPTRHHAPRHVFPVPLRRPLSGHFSPASDNSTLFIPTRFRRITSVPHLSSPTLHHSPAPTRHPTPASVHLRLLQSAPLQPDAAPPDATVPLRQPSSRPPRPRLLTPDYSPPTTHPRLLTPDYSPPSRPLPTTHLRHASTPPRLLDPLHPPADFPVQLPSIRFDYPLPATRQPRSSQSTSTFHVTTSPALSDYPRMYIDEYIL